MLFCFTGFLLLLVELFGCILWKQRNLSELAQFHNQELTEVGLFLGPDLGGTESAFVSFQWDPAEKLNNRKRP